MLKTAGSDIFRDQPFRQERKAHAVTVAGTYSTDLGISLSTTWSHRNLFGNAEQLNLTAAGTGLGTASTGLGYTLILAINQSDFLVVQGIVLTVSVLVVAINFFFDFVINVVDPRISRE